jgi:hypothetical protein
MLFIDFKKAYDSVPRKVQHSNLTEFGIHMNLDKVIKIKFIVSPYMKTFVSCISHFEWSEIRICFITTAFQCCFGIHH